MDSHSGNTSSSSCSNRLSCFSRGQALASRADRSQLPVAACSFQVARSSSAGPFLFPPFKAIAVPTRTERAEAARARVTPDSGMRMEKKFCDAVWQGTTPPHFCSSVDHPLLSSALLRFQIFVPNDTKEIFLYSVTDE